MAHDVFISYSSVDQKIVEGLSAYLEQNGIRCFVAYRDIPKGVVWAKTITEAIEQAKIMVVVFSEHFNRSDQVDREIELCIEEGHPLLTFKIQDYAFTGAKKYYLKNINWIDAFPNPEKSFGELYGAIARLLSPDGAAPTAAPPAKKPVPVTSAPETAVGSDDAAVQYELGVKYENGNGVERDYVKAVECYRRAAEKGLAAAQYNLGEMYYNGKGVAQDYAKAVEWYRKAAEQGHTTAQNDMGYMYQFGNGVAQDYAAALDWYRKTAEKGNATAQNNLGKMYENGLGVTQDCAKALEWYRKSAEQEYATAQYNIGDMYYNGKDVAQDYTKAVEWYRKAAEQGHTTAQNDMGYMYQFGKGVEQDYAKAAEWYRKAAEQGHATAQNNLEALYRN